MRIKKDIKKPKPREKNQYVDTFGLRPMNISTAVFNKYFAENLLQK